MPGHLAIRMNNKIKKNILDLQFQKYLIIASTSVIITFTYIIGIVLASLTKQIKFDNFFSMILVFLFSTVVFGLCAFFLFKSLFHIKNILRILKDIK